MLWDDALRSAFGAVADARVHDDDPEGDQGINEAAGDERHDGCAEQQADRQACHLPADERQRARRGALGGRVAAENVETARRLLAAEATGRVGVQLLQDGIGALRMPLGSLAVTVGRAGQGAIGLVCRGASLPLDGVARLGGRQAPTGLRWGAAGPARGLPALRNRAVHGGHDAAEHVGMADAWIERQQDGAGQAARVHPGNGTDAVQARLNCAG
jgi:hypothetical protein